MARRRELPSRREVSEKVDTSKEKMHEKEIELDITTLDVETVRETLESLDFEGTSEGSEEVEGAIENAENITVDEFDREDEELERIQDENEVYEGEMNERSDSSESDLEKIRDASGRIETKEAVNKLAEAKESSSRDIEFLKEQIDRANGARKESEEKQVPRHRRVHAGGK